MFNLYEFEKRVRSEEQEMYQTMREKKINRNLKQMNETLSKNYKTRVAHFIKQMIVQPIKENDYYDGYKSLQHSKNKYVAHHSFRFTSSQRERVIEAQTKNSFLDTSPTQLHTGKFIEQLMDLRPRIKEKEIGPEKFRHTPITRIEQVYDTITNRTSSMLSQKDKYDFNTVKRLRGQSVMAKTSITPMPYDLTELSTFTSTIKRNKSPNKMLPDLVKPADFIPKLHDKTHFKAATSVFLNHHGTLAHQQGEETGRQVEKILNDKIYMNS